MVTPTQEKSRRQHYVPQFYLRGFESSDGKLWAFDKSDGRIFPTGTAGVAAANNFYDLAPDVPEGDAARRFNECDMGERSMQSFERLHNNALNLLISEGRHVGIQPDVRESLKLALAIQHLRTPTFREELKNYVETHLDELALQLTKQNFPGQEHFAPKVTIGEETLAAHHMKSLIDVDAWRTIGEALNSHAWTLGIAPPGSHFVTSDNPLSRRCHLASFGRMFTGFRSPGIEFIYPVNSQLVLTISERIHHPDAHELDNHAFLVTPERVSYCNRVVAANCDRFLFAKNGDFIDVGAFFDRNPSLKTGRWDNWVTRSTKPRRAGNRGKARKQKRQFTETYIEPPDIAWDP